MDDYRIFVGAFPTGVLAGDIQAVRRAIDAKTARITPPHVTLAGTFWRNGSATAAGEATLIAGLQPLTAVLRPFTLALGGIATFGRRVIYLDVAPTAELTAVRRALLGVTGQDKHRAWVPHLTLAMRLTGSAFDQALAELRAGPWHSERFAAPIDRLQLMQRGPSDPAWRVIHTLPLAG